MDAWKWEGNVELEPFPSYRGTRGKTGRCADLFWGGTQLSCITMTLPKWVTHVPWGCAASIVSSRVGSCCVSCSTSHRDSLQAVLLCHRVVCSVHGLLCPHPQTFIIFRKSTFYFPQSLFCGQRERQRLLSGAHSLFTLFIQWAYKFCPPQLVFTFENFLLIVFNLHIPFWVRNCCSSFLINITSCWVNLILIKRKMAL